MTCHHSSYTKLTFIFFTIILILSCSPKEECISCSSKEKEGETEIGIIPIEDALANLNHFLADVNLLETKSGNKRSISSIDTHFSDFAVTKSGDERIGASSDSGTSPTPSKTEILPLLTRDLFFSQNVTYCHKSKNRFVTNGCASTAISMIIAYKQYPRLTVDHEVLDYSQCGIADGLGLYYDFLDDDVFIKLDDYFTNSDILPDLTYFSDTDLYKLLERIDNKVIVKHNSPLSVYLNYPFYRTRFILTSAVYYSLHNIIKSWDGTGVLPDAAVFGMMPRPLSQRHREKQTMNGVISTFFLMILSPQSLSKRLTTFTTNIVYTFINDNYVVL